MSELEAVTPSHDDEEIVGEPIMTAREVDSDSGTATSYMLIKHMDDEVVFYKNVNTQRELHSHERREVFDENVGSGYYKFPDPEDVEEIKDVKENGKLEDLLEVKGVGDSGIEELKKHGYDNVRDVVEESKSNLIEVPKIGRKSAQRIMDNFADDYGADHDSSNNDGGSKVKGITTAQSNDSTRETKTDSNDSGADSTDNDSNDDADSGSDDDGWETLVDSDDSEWEMNKL